MRTQPGEETQVGVDFFAETSREQVELPAGEAGMEARLSCQGILDNCSRWQKIQDTALESSALYPFSPPPQLATIKKDNPQLADDL
jgi:hypothetical protein